MRLKRIIFFFLIINLSCLSMVAQVSITGPTCVVPGLQYQYVINGNWDSLMSIKICVEGGVINNDIANCSTIPPVKVLNVKWTDTLVSGGRIFITSSSGNATISISKTHPLCGGSVDSLLLVQYVDSVTIPERLTVSVATGGGCITSYHYQWQQSIDNLEWIDVQDANSETLLFSSAFRQTTYFRRRTTDLSSNTIAYSNIAVVAIENQSPQY